MVSLLRSLVVSLPRSLVGSLVWYLLVVVVFLVHLSCRFLLAVFLLWILGRCLLLFTPWVSSFVTSSSPWPVLPALVSSVALVSSTSVSLAGNLSLSHPSLVVGGGVSSSPAVAGSSFAMSSILAPVSTVVSSCGMSSGVSVSWSAPSLVSSVPPVVWSSVAGLVPSVPVVGAVSGVTSTGGGFDSVAHKNTSAIPVPEGSVGFCRSFGICRG